MSKFCAKMPDSQRPIFRINQASPLAVQWKRNDPKPNTSKTVALFHAIPISKHFVKLTKQT